MSASGALTPAARLRRRRSTVRDRAELWLYRCAAGAIGLLPRGAAAALGASAAAAYTRLSSRRRAILLDNLRRAFPEKTPHEIETIARDSVRSFGAVLMDFLAPELIEVTIPGGRPGACWERHLRITHL